MVISRKATYPIGELFLNRWSPRALSGEPIPHDDLMALFEAARWAPSSYNNQPWRFIVAERGTPQWKVIFNLLGEFNQGWAKNAAVLVVVVSANNFERNGKTSVTHSFDAGAAWMSLALEASRRGYVTHGMEGFDYGQARNELDIPSDYTVEAMLAIGKMGRKEDLPQALQEHEAPSDRKPLGELVFNGKFGEKMIP